MRVAGKGNYRTVSNNDRYRSTVVPLDDCGLREGVIKRTQQISVLLLTGAVTGQISSG